MARYFLSWRLPTEGDAGSELTGESLPVSEGTVPVGEAGTSAWAQHAYGLAVDINPFENPEIQDGKADPPAIMDRNPRKPKDVKTENMRASRQLAMEAAIWLWPIQESPPAAACLGSPLIRGPLSRDWRGH